MFSATHIVTLVVFLLVMVLLTAARNKFKRDSWHRVFRYGLATFLLVSEVTFHIWTAWMGRYSLDMVPLGFCAMVNWITIFALFTDNRKIIAVTYYWAITGAFFSLIFIDMSYVPPHFRFFHYFLVHFGFFLAHYYYLVTGRIQIDKKGLLKSIKIMLPISVIVYILDILFKQNWMYFMQSPVKEISDFFGTPLYSFLWAIAIGILFVLWYWLSIGCIRLFQRLRQKPGAVAENSASGE